MLVRVSLYSSFLLPKGRSIEWYVTQWKSAHLVCMRCWAHLALGTDGGRAGRSLLWEHTVSTVDLVREVSQGLFIPEEKPVWWLSSAIPSTAGWGRRTPMSAGLQNGPLSKKRPEESKFYYIQCTNEDHTRQRDSSSERNVWEWETKPWSINKNGNCRRRWKTSLGLAVQGTWTVKWWWCWCTVRGWACRSVFESLPSMRKTSRCL